MQPRLIALATVIGFAALYRVLPHPPNIAPVASMALFAGAYFQNRWLALLTPLLSMFLSDMILGFHSSMVYVYGGMALTVLIGFSLRSSVTAGHVLLASLGGSASFFLITNFGAWLGSAMYPQTAAGLLQSYLAGVPFMYYSVIGDLLFAALFFGSYAAVQMAWPTAEKPAG